MGGPAFAQSPSADPQLSLEGRVDEVFAEYDSTRSPGCALGVIRDGEMVYARGYGMANLEHGIAIGPQTVFRIGSTSKQFAAFAILLLEEEGALRLEDDIRGLLPEMPVYERPVTIAHLVHHTSGVRDYLTLMDLAGQRDFDYYTDEEVVDLLSRQKELNFLPGDEWLYSNSGYFLLSVLVERASGMRLAEFAEKRIFRPLGMNQTHFHDDATRIVCNRASGYARDQATGYRISQTTLPMVGDGGVFTTVEDLLNWDRNFYDNELGPQEMLNQQLKTARLINGKDTGYAMGLSVDDYRGQKLVSHGGAFVGYRAEMIRFPEQRLSVSVLCNLAQTNPSRLARQVADVYLGDLLEPVERPPPQIGEHEAETPSPGATPAVAELQRSQKLQRFQRQLVGEYYSSEIDARYRIELVDGELWLRHADPHRVVSEEPLERIGNDQLKAGYLRLHLERRDGEISGFRLGAGRVKNLLFERQPFERQP